MTIFRDNSDSRPSTLSPVQRKDRSRIKFNVSGTKDSVLILYDTDDNLRLYFTSGAVGPSEGILRFYLEISHKFVF